MIEYIVAVFVLPHCKVFNPGSHMLSTVPRRGHLSYITIYQFVPRRLSY